MNRRGFFGALAGGIAALTGRVPARPGQYATIRTATLFGRTDTLLSRIDRSITGPDLFVAPKTSVAAVAGDRVEQIAQHLTGELGEGFQCVDGGLPIGVVAGRVAPGDEVALGIGHDDADRVVSGPCRLSEGPAPEQVDEQLLQRCDAAAQLSPFGPDLHVLPSCAFPLPVDTVVVWGGKVLDAQLSNRPSPDHHGLIASTAGLPPIGQIKDLLELFGSSGEAGPAFVEALIGELVLTRVRLAAADPRILCSLEPVTA